MVNPPVTFHSMLIKPTFPFEIKMLMLMQTCEVRVNKDLLLCYNFNYEERKKVELGSWFTN